MAALQHVNVIISDMKILPDANIWCILYKPIASRLENKEHMRFK